MLGLKCCLNVRMAQHRRLSVENFLKVGRQFEHILIADDRFVVVRQCGVDVAQCVVCVRYVRCDVNGTVQYYGCLLKGSTSMQDCGQREQRNRPILVGTSVQSTTNALDGTLCIAYATPVEGG